MTLSKTQKITGLILSVLAVPTAVVTLWATCDLPTPATEHQLEQVTEELAETAIDVYSQQERDLRREELDLRERIQQRENTTNTITQPDGTTVVPPEEIEYQRLLKETLEDTQEEKTEVKKKREYFEEKALDLKKGK